ncbi:MAG: aspartyl/asparaginyl beta-hydroxylase domain-containing protein [Chitinophagales bacterium]|nr:aspartyl/asparaginyl beta-hydroxylase domain-containing protein [Chitinophagales bacterium]MDW8417786.1 aspartyl/asparaginyl beta-hydroxylase domain-containing protein [Chitinophagales bacterium]
MSRVVYLYSDYALHEESEPTVYEPAAYPAIQHVLKHYQIIKDEVHDYIHRKFDIPYRNPSAPEMTYPDSWKNIYFKNYLLRYPLGPKYFPKTSAIIDAHPHITLAGITTLAPKSRLKMHCGETNAIIRCHLGLKVPGKLPEIGMRVKDTLLEWEEGKVFAFNDAYQHEAWNNTDEYRYVLVFDIIRPEFAHLRTWVCARCLGIEAMRYLLSRLGIYEKTPIGIRKAMALPAACLLYIYLKIRGN